MSGNTTVEQTDFANSDKLQSEPFQKEVWQIAWISMFKLQQCLNVTIVDH